MDQSTHHHCTNNKIIYWIPLQKASFCVCEKHAWHNQPPLPPNLTHKHTDFIICTQGCTSNLTSLNTTGTMFLKGQSFWSFKIPHDCSWGGGKVFNSGTYSDLILSFWWGMGLISLYGLIISILRAHCFRSLFIEWFMTQQVLLMQTLLVLYKMKIRFGAMLDLRTW